MTALEEYRHRARALTVELRETLDLVERLQERERVAGLTPAQRRGELRVIAGGRSA